MLGFFPDPYPDELLYSVCARYHRRVRHISKTYTLLDLFGEGARSLSLLLPNRLDHLIAVLPSGHRYSADRLIDEHTLLPFFVPFLRPHRSRLLRNSMKQTSSTISTHGYAGIPSGRFNNGYLRFCRLCADEDTKIFGEPYWHRLHQVPGVEICLRHESALESSKVSARKYRSNREVLITAEEALLIIPSCPPVLPGSWQLYVQLVQDITWLLNQRNLSVSPNNLHACYICILLSKGMICRHAKRRFTVFRLQFKKYFSSEYLDSLNCGVEGSGDWLSHFLWRQSFTHHPLRHLLIINFLGYTAENFFSLFHNKPA